MKNQKDLLRQCLQLIILCFSSSVRFSLHQAADQIGRHQQVGAGGLGRKGRKASRRVFGRLQDSHVPEIRSKHDGKTAVNLANNLMIFIIFQTKINLLHDAVNSGKLEELKALLADEPDKGKKLSLAKDESGVGLLHKAVYYDLKDIVKWLCENYPETVITKDSVSIEHTMQFVIKVQYRFPLIPRTFKGIIFMAPISTGTIIDSSWKTQLTMYCV